MQAIKHAILTRHKDAVEDTTLLPRDRLLPFSLVAALFFLWGIPNNLNDILIRQFMKSFVAIDCSAHPLARNLAIRATGKWGRIVFLGEGGPVSFDPSPDLMHG